MSDAAASQGRSISAEHLAAVDELVRLEDENIGGGLSAEQKQRWGELTQRLFGPGAGQERRQFFRVQTQQAAEILGADTAELPAEVTSLSAGGLFLRTGVACDELIGRELDIVVRFPLVHEEAQRFKVQVCWVGPGGDGEPGFGARFLDLDSRQRRFLLEHLRTHLVRLLELSREKYNFFFQQSADVAVLLGAEGNILEVSEATEAFLGLPAAALIGQPATTLVPPEGAAALQEGLERTQRRERTRLEVHLRGAAGALFPVELLLTPFHVRDLRVGTMFVAHDLRPLRRIEERQRALERQLLQTDKLATIGQIAASLAHDLNNPLAYVLTNVTLLEEYVPALQTLVTRALDHGDSSGVSDEQLRALETDLADLVGESRQGLQRMRDIVADLKDYTRMDSRGVARVDVNQALEASLRILRNFIDHRARLERDYASDLPVTSLDYSQLAQVLLNLLTNAAQSFERADVRRNVVRVATRLVEGQIVVEIGDNGPGIPEEIRELVFQPFFTTRGATGALGLGLAVARESAKALGATLELRGTGGGTRFVVSLPVRDGQVAPVRAAATAARRRVLVIDDEPTVLRSLERALSRHCQVSSTVSPQRALELLAGERFDAILCDVMIPEMRGTDFRDEVLRRFPGSHPKIVFMTGGAFDISDAERTVLNGHTVLAKPIDVRQLRTALGVG